MYALARDCVCSNTSDSVANGTEQRLLSSAEKRRECRLRLGWPVTPFPRSQPPSPGGDGSRCRRRRLRRPRRHRCLLHFLLVRPATFPLFRLPTRQLREPLHHYYYYYWFFLSLSFSLFRLHTRTTLVVTPGHAVPLTSNLSPFYRYLPGVRYLGRCAQRAQYRSLKNQHPGHLRVRPSRCRSRDRLRIV